MCQTPGCTNPKHAPTVAELFDVANAAALEWSRAEFALGRTDALDASAWDAAMKKRGAAQNAYYAAMRELMAALLRP